MALLNSYSLENVTEGRIRIAPDPSTKINVFFINSNNYEFKTYNKPNSVSNHNSLQLTLNNIVNITPQTTFKYIRNLTT